MKAKPVEDVMAEVLAQSPADRFEIVAELLRDKRPEMIRVGWSLAHRTVQEWKAIEALEYMRRLREESTAICPECGRETKTYISPWDGIVTFVAHGATSKNATERCDGSSQPVKPLKIETQPKEP
jgi:RNA polymerase subunit RPABC4/transcription elongation factor Spt4